MKETVLSTFYRKDFLMRMINFKLICQDNQYLDVLSLVEDCIKASVLISMADELNDMVHGKIELAVAIQELTSFLKDERNSRVAEHILLELCVQQLRWFKIQIGSNLTQEINYMRQIVGERLFSYYLKRLFTYDDHQLLLQSLVG